jgi:hypothetical protein
MNENQTLPLTSELNLFNAIILIGVSLPTLYIGAKVRIYPLKIISILLPSFLLLHGIFHLLLYMKVSQGSEFFGSIGNIVLEPLSYSFLLAFALYFAKRGG